jgi:hypothetical protein
MYGYVMHVYIYNIIYIYTHIVSIHIHITIYWFSKAQGFHPLQSVTRGKPVPLDQLQPSALDRPFLAQNFVTFSIYIYVHIPRNLYEQLSLSIFGFYAQETFLHIWVFVFDGLFKSFDSPGIPHPPTGSHGRVPKSGHTYYHICHEICMCA